MKISRNAFDDLGDLINIEKLRCSRRKTQLNYIAIAIKNASDSSNLPDEAPEICPRLGTIDLLYLYPIFDRIQTKVIGNSDMQRQSSRNWIAVANTNGIHESGIAEPLFELHD